MDYVIILTREKGDKHWRYLGSNGNDYHRLLKHRCTIWPLSKEDAQKVVNELDSDSEYEVVEVLGPEGSQALIDALDDDPEYAPEYDVHSEADLRKILAKKY